MDNHQIFILCIVISCLLVAIDVVLLFLQRLPVGVLTFCALALSVATGAVHMATLNVVLWGVTVAMLVALFYMLPRNIACSRVGVPFIAEGAIAGALIGLLLNSMVGVITCSAVGALLGAVVFARTPGGKVLGFPTRKFFNYFAAKAFGAVTMCSLATLLLNNLLQ